MCVDMRRLTVSSYKYLCLTIYHKPICTIRRDKDGKYFVCTFTSYGRDDCVGVSLLYVKYPTIDGYSRAIIKAALGRGHDAQLTPGTKSFKSWIFGNFISKQR